jgi:hypothetical protein
VLVPWATQTNIVGGSKHTDVNELAVMECGFPCSSTLVTTVTPVANLDIAVRKSLLEVKAYPLIISLGRLYYSSMLVS